MEISVCCLQRWYYCHEHRTTLSLSSKTILCSYSCQASWHFTGRSVEIFKNTGHNQKYLATTLSNKWWALQGQWKLDQQEMHQQSLPQRTLDKSIPENDCRAVRIQVHGFCFLLHRQVGSPCQPNRLHSQLSDSRSNNSRDGTAKQPFDLSFYLVLSFGMLKNILCWPAHCFEWKACLNLRTVSVYSSSGAEQQFWRLFELLCSFNWKWWTLDHTHVNFLVSNSIKLNWNVGVIGSDGRKCPLQQSQWRPVHRSNSTCVVE